MRDQGSDQQAESPIWSLDAAQWEAIRRQASSGPDCLRDGAWVRANMDADGQAELLFYAGATNKPLGWAYPFLEDVPQSKARAALIGMARYEADAGRVAFEVVLPAAAAALAADYESGASDLDFVTYEQAVESAVRGTPADLDWLHREFGRLAVLTVS